LTPGRAVTGLAFAADGRLAAGFGQLPVEVSGPDPSPRGVQLWDAAGRPVGTLAGHTQDLIGVAFAPDGRRLASCAGSLSGQAAGRTPDPVVFV
jgi:WD40 repeat protein